MCRVAYAEWDGTTLGGGERRARKARPCGDCGRTIAAGEHYRFDTSAYDGKVSTVSTCAHCVAAAEWLRAVCGGWLWTQIGEELREHMDEEDDFRCRTLALLVAEHGRRWTDKDGKLLPLAKVRSQTSAATKFALVAIGRADQPARMAVAS